MIALLAAATVVAQEPPGASRRGDIRQIQGRIRELQSALDAAQAQARDLLGRYASTRAELRLQELRVTEAEAELAAAVERRDASVEEVARSERLLEESRDRLRRRLSSIDRFAGQGYLRLFLDVERSADLLTAIRQLRLLVRRDAAALDRYRVVRGKLEEQRRELEQRRQEAQAWVDTQRQRRDQVARLESRQRQLLREVRERRTRLAQRAGELSEKGSRLERLVELIESEDAGAFQGVSIEEFRGVLDWPAIGMVITEFGPRRDPLYRTTLPQHGIELSVSAGAPVRCVFPGRVMFAAPFQDLGFTVVVQHTGRVLTLYAGLERLRVEEGDVLTSDAVVGVASERLYFEIRRGSQPENPREWLR